MPQRLAAEIGEARDGGVLGDDQFVADAPGLDAAPLQAEHLERAGEPVFRQRRDAGRRARGANLGASGHEGVDDLVGRFETGRLNVDAGLLEHLLVQRHVEGHGLHDRQPRDRDLLQRLRQGRRGRHERRPQDSQREAAAVKRVGHAHLQSTTGPVDQAPLQGE